LERGYHEVQPLREEKRREKKIGERERGAGREKKIGERERSRKREEDRRERGAGGEACREEGRVVLAGKLISVIEIAEGNVDC
jgi:hypothetical protein